MERDPIGNDVRKARRERRLGERAACLFCGQSTPEALTKVKRSMLEEHHVVGRVNDSDITVPICLNCHRLLSEGQLAHGIELRHKPGAWLERLAAVLEGVAIFFKQLADNLLTWARRLRKHINWLDANNPEWRDDPEYRA